jgi:hypothetical protein
MALHNRLYGGRRIGEPSKIQSFGREDPGVRCNAWGNLPPLCDVRGNAFGQRHLPRRVSRLWDVDVAAIKPLAETALRPRSDPSIEEPGFRPAHPSESGKLIDGAFRKHELITRAREAGLTVREARPALGRVRMARRG